MNFCSKCAKQTPTKITETAEECMVCGSVINKLETKNGKKFVNDSMMKDMKKLTEKNKDTGKYNQAQTVGRNVLIGLLVILMGIFYSIGGIDMVLQGTFILFILLLTLSVILFLIAMVSD